MNGPRCHYCHHYNHAAAEFCEACESPLINGPAAGEHAPAAGRPSAQSTAADSVPSPPFKRAGDVVSPMLAVYRKHFTLVGILVLAVTMPEALLRYFVVDFTGAGAMLTGVGMSFTSVQGWLLWLLALAGSALLSSALVYAVIDLQCKGSAAAGQCLARGLKVLPKVYPVTVLYAIIVTAGSMLLLVPGVILSLMFVVCVPVAVIEGRGPIDALTRSYELTKGFKGLLFMASFLWGLFILVLNWLVIRSFMRGANLDLLPSLLLQTAVLGMLNSSAHVLNVYVYLGLLRERRTRFQADAFAQGAPAAG